MSAVWQFNINYFCLRKGSCRRLSSGNSVIGGFKCKKSNHDNDDIHQHDIIIEVDTDLNLVNKVINN